MLGLLCIDFKLKRQLWKRWNVSLEYSWNALFKSCASLSSSSCHARHIFTQAWSVLHTQSLILPLTLCVWPTVPFTLIKTTNVSTLPLPPLLTLHCLPLWQLKPLSHWLVWCHPLNNCLSPTPPLPSQPSTRSLLERPRPSPLTGEHSSSTTMLLQRGKEEDKGNILIHSASSSIFTVIAVSQITPLSIHLLSW